MLLYFADFTLGPPHRHSTHSIFSLLGFGPSAQPAIPASRLLSFPFFYSIQLLFDFILFSQLTSLMCFLHSLKIWR